ncbi:hypothetical protein KIM372_00660 [Bombiscardovia nodaiensis]|uniref:Uncharacterized protein n=1 Tax=Bombiscardovia nodaiensis TaxID=2932181 RepID=A0ABN6S7F1_9BIFI|nr:hypothetical protein KIM372_00660 [Bombiscardovia nodaiensis]
MSIPLYVGLCALVVGVIAALVGRPWGEVLTNAYTIIGLACGTLTYCCIVFVVPVLRKAMLP